MGFWSELAENFLCERSKEKPWCDHVGEIGFRSWSVGIFHKTLLVLHAWNAARSPKCHSSLGLSANSLRRHSHQTRNDLDEIRISMYNNYDNKIKKSHGPMRCFSEQDKSTFSRSIPYVLGFAKQSCKSGSI